MKLPEVRRTGKKYGASDRSKWCIICCRTSQLRNGAAKVSFEKIRRCRMKKHKFWAWAMIVCLAMTIYTGHKHK